MTDAHRRRHAQHRRGDHQRAALVVLLGILLAMALSYRVLEASRTRQDMRVLVERSPFGGFRARRLRNATLRDAAAELRDRAGVVAYGRIVLREGYGDASFPVGVAARHGHAHLRIASDDVADIESITRAIERATGFTPRARSWSTLGAPSGHPARVAYVRWERTGGGRELPLDLVIVGAPAWIAVLVLRSMALQMARDRARTRLEKEICPRCGYDLRGLRDPVCPECGEDLRN
ncbi:MAG: hypothetical protein AAFX79_13040 [Planctomycetota bacterium]